MRCLRGSLLALTICFLNADFFPCFCERSEAERGGRDSPARIKVWPPRALAELLPVRLSHLAFQKAIEERDIGRLLWILRWELISVC